MTAILLAAAVNFTVQTAVHPDDFKHYDTEKIRDRFVMKKVMETEMVLLNRVMILKMGMEKGMEIPMNLEKKEIGRDRIRIIAALSTCRFSCD